MSRASRTLAVIAVIAALAGSLVAFTTTTAAAGPGYHQPKVGTCYDLTKRQMFAQAVSEDTVPCTSRHTSLVIHVQRVPRNTDWHGRMPFSFFKKCAAKVQDRLKASDRAVESSAYDSFWFIPTKAERAHGARWLSCHLALWGGKRMRPLPANNSLALDALPLEDSVARCLSGGKLYYAACSKPHSFRVTGAFRLSSKKYPTRKRFERAVVQRCPSLVTSKRWRWEPANSAEWAAGNRAVVCYSKTRK